MKYALHFQHNFVRQDGMKRMTRGCNARAPLSEVLELSAIKQRLWRCLRWPIWIAESLLHSWDTSVWQKTLCKCPRFKPRISSTRVSWCYNVPPIDIYDREIHSKKAGSIDHRSGRWVWRRMYGQTLPWTKQSNFSHALAATALSRSYQQLRVQNLPKEIMHRRSVWRWMGGLRRHASRRQNGWRHRYLHKRRNSIIYTTCIMILRS